MNFSFRIIRLGNINNRCQFYTILKDRDEHSEANKFLQNERNKKSADFDRIKVRLKEIKNRFGARIGYFKTEGQENDLVYALHAGTRKQGYLQLNKLRWYCVRLSERCVILGNGDVNPNYSRKL